MADGDLLLVAGIMWQIAALIFIYYPQFVHVYVYNVNNNKFAFSQQAYRPCAQRASILFFILNDMGRIDPMYQFSLDAYINLFNLSIEKSKRSQKLEERITNLNDYHTYAVYR